MLEAFRLGATDFVAKLLREAGGGGGPHPRVETVAQGRQGDRLAEDLEATQAQNKALSGQLAALGMVGDMVVRGEDLRSLFARVLDSVVELTGADYAMLLLRDDKLGKLGRLVLRAGKNLPLAMLDHLDEPVQDQLADLVMTSREPLTVSGEALRRFAVASDLQAAAYVPLVVQSTAIGVLAVGTSAGRGVQRRAGPGAQNASDHRHRPGECAPAGRDRQRA